MILLARNRTRQPQRIAGVGKSNPITRGLWALVDFSGGLPVEVVRNKVFSKTGAPFKTVGKAGNAVNATGSTDVFSLTGMTPSIAVTSGISVAILSEVDAQTLTRKRAIRLAGSAGTIAAIDYSDGGGYDYLFGVQKAGGSFTSLHGTASPYPLGINLLTLVHPAGSSSTLGYQNEVLQTGSATSVAGDFASTIDALYIANSVSGFPLNGKLYFAAVWSRALSPAEVAQLAKNPWQVFERRKLLVGIGVTVQIARPISDLSNTGWVPSTGTDLYPMIGETVRDDGTYIGATVVGALCEVGLSSIADPNVSTDHSLPPLVLSAPGGGGITVRLRQGTTTIASWTYHPGPTPTEYTPTLSGAEADSITDYTALRLEFEAVA